MGKASRKKHLKRQQITSLEKYSGVKLSEALMLFLLLLSSSAWAASHAPLLGNVKPGTITIVGETHRRIESTQFFEGLVYEALQQNQCLTLALEIDDNQQAAIDRVMTEGGAVADMTISSIIEAINQQNLKHQGIGGRIALDKIMRGCAMSDNSDWKKDIDESEKKFKEDTEQAIEKLDELQSDWEKAREQLEEIAKKRKERLESEEETRKPLC